MNTGIVAQLDQMIAERHLLKHPFYQAWTAGTLPMDSLKHYAVQYYRHVEAFPRYLSAIHSRCNDLGVRQALLENLIEEERGPENHPELWLRFAEGLGVSRESVLDTEPEAATRNLVDTFMTAARESSVAAGLAALYVYEAQIPAVATAKIEGLRRFYSIGDECTLRFFSVHEKADVYHAQTGAELIEHAESGGSKAEILDVARRVLDALWETLSSVYRDQTPESATV